MRSLCYYMIDKLQNIPTAFEKNLSRHLLNMIKNTLLEMKHFTEDFAIGEEDCVQL